MNKGSAAQANSIDEWKRLMFPDASAEKVFDGDNTSPEVIATKWVERAIDTLPNKPINKPTR